MIWTICLLSTALTLIACSGVQEQLGLGRNVPDAFKVVTREPLELPPDTNVLPPPRPGAPRPQEAAIQTRAAETLLGNAPATSSAPSQTEMSILQQGGAYDGPENIRELVDADARIETTEQQPLGRRLLGLGPEQGTSVIDPEEELERLEQQTGTVNEK
jgi:Protein of unknown function (DUF3035).